MKLLIVKQILPVIILGNVRRAVWRICILMLGCKGWNEGESFEPVTNKFLVVTRAMSFRAWMVESYLQILQYLGRAPKDMDKLTSKLKTLHELDAIAAEQAKRMVSFSWFRSPIAFKLWKKIEKFLIENFNHL